MDKKTFQADYSPERHMPGHVSSCQCQLTPALPPHQAYLHTPPLTTLSTDPGFILSTHDKAAGVEKHSLAEVGAQSQSLSCISIRKSGILYLSDSIPRKPSGAQGCNSAFHRMLVTVLVLYNLFCKVSNRSLEMCTLSTFPNTNLKREK